MATAKGGTAQGAEALWIRGLLEAKLWLMALLVVVLCAAGGAGYALSTAGEADPGASELLRLWLRSQVPFGSVSVQTDDGPRALAATDLAAWVERDPRFRKALRRVTIDSCIRNAIRLGIHLEGARHAATGVCEGSGEPSASSAGAA